MKDAKVIQHLLTLLGEKDIRLWVENGDLKFNAPKGVFTDQLKQQVKDHKAEILRYLSNQSSQMTENLYALSPMQAGMLFHSQLAPNSGTYIEHTLLHVDDLTFDASLLIRALQAVINRHESLRAAFRFDHGHDPVQVIYTHVRLPVTILDWHALTAEEYQARFADLVATDRLTDFDFAQAPLLRLTVVERAQGGYDLLFTFHHILMDRWSVDLFWAEVQGGYAGLPLPKALPYQAYIRHLRQQPEDAAFWRDYLRGFTAPTPLPALPTPNQTASRVASLSQTIPADVTQDLIRFARTEGITLNALFQAAWALLLARYANETDIVFGMVTSGRTAPLQGIERSIGLFINTLPLRVQLDATTAGHALLRQVAQTQLELQQREHTPLIDVQRWSELPAGAKLFDTLLLFQNTPQSANIPSANASPHLALRLGWVEPAGTGYPLVALIAPAECITLLLTYDPARYDADTIARILTHWQQLVLNIVAQPDQPVLHLPLLTAAEYHQIVYEWNNTVVDFGPPQTIHALFEQQVARTPDAIAVVIAEPYSELRITSYENRASAPTSAPRHSELVTRLTYAELNARANQLAHHLIECGVQPDTLVAVAMERSIEMLVSLLAVLKAGGAYVPIDPTYPPERIAFMLADSAALILLTQSHLTLAQGAAQPSTHVITVDDMNAPWTGQSTSTPRTATAPTDLAYVIYTSGSTGRPKGVMIPHQNLSYHLQWLKQRLQMTNTDVILQKTPYGFDASVWELFCPLVCGAQLLLAPIDVPRDIHQLHRSLQNAVTIVQLVPSQLRLLLEVGDFTQYPALRQVVCGGEPLSDKLLSQLFSHRSNLTVHNFYGPTEATIQAICWLTKTPVDAPPIGQPVANTQVYILNEQGSIQPVAVAGELYIGGVQLARGYLNHPDLTAARFIAHPAFGRLYKTGDLCRWLPDGNIEYIGRSDFQVKLRGFRIELGEIESVLLAHPGVREAVVLAREDSPGAGAPGAQLVAYVVGEAQQETLRQALAQRLPDYMIPAAFVKLATLPLTPNGKLDRKALPAPDRSTLTAKENFVPPNTPLEIALARIWCEVLGLEQVGIDHNFFEVGGDSILSIQIVGRAKQAGIQLTTKHVFQHPTIRTLAGVVRTGTQSSAEQGIVTGELPLTPIQQWFLEQAWAEPHHFNQAVLLETAPTLNTHWLETALTSLLRHHDALRLRFYDGKQGSWPEGDSGRAQRWRQVNQGMTETFALEVIDLSSLPTYERQERLESVANDTQASLDLHKGPLLRAVLFFYGAQEPGRLLLVIHHLVVDGVSWRILLEDLQTAYQQSGRGEVIQLPPKTTAFRDWAHWLASKGLQQVMAEREWWQQMAQSAERATSTRLPVDFAPPVLKNDTASTDSISCSLSVADTDALLHQAPSAYHTQVNDLLLTALAQTISEWSGIPYVTLELEGHGRELGEEAEEGGDQIDLSRTVGWFTSVFPVTLHLDQHETGELIKSIKEQLRRIPNRGIGYGILRYIGQMTELIPAKPIDLSFNYLGQFDTTLAPSASDRTAARAPFLFGFAAESSGQAYSSQEKRVHLIDINGQIIDGQLSFSWTYSCHFHKRNTIEQVAQTYITHLRALIAHCLHSNAGGFTPSDFSALAVNQTELDQIMADIALELEG